MLPDSSVWEYENSMRIWIYINIYKYWGILMCIVYFYDTNIKIYVTGTHTRFETGLCTDNILPKKYEMSNSLSF